MYSRRLAGRPPEADEPWRDTGVELRGPVVPDLAHAFAATWAEAGSPLPHANADDAAPILVAGGVTARVIAGRPGTLSTYRLDQFVASAARRSLWLTDAYFVATRLCAGAASRLRATAWTCACSCRAPATSRCSSAITRAGYRPLLEAGVRVFEWNGPMLHAKTAVADGRWTRIGSTNLNLASWLGNWELDVTITDAGFAQTVAEAYLADLSNATEIVLDAHESVRAAGPVPRQRGTRPGSASRLAAGAVSLGNAAGAAVTAGRSLAGAEAKAIAHIGLVLLCVAALALAVPLLIVGPLAAALVWIGISLLGRAWKLRRAGRGRAAGRTP